MTTISQCGQLLKELECSLYSSSHQDSWSGKRSHFHSAINDIKHVSSGTKELFNQLRSLERSVKYEMQSDSWKQWKRELWKVMADVDINLRITTTRFIICLRMMERNLVTEAHSDSWGNSDRSLWVGKCKNLIDPLLQLSFYDEMYLNINVVLNVFGYSSLEDYDCKMSQVISTINDAADKLDKICKGTGIAEATSGGLGITSGVLAGCGLILAPVTAGGSLFLTGAATVAGIGGAATSITSSTIQIISDKKTVEEVEKETKSITAETMALIELLQNYASSAGSLKMKLDSLGKFKAMKYLKEAGLGSYNIYNGVSNTIDIIRMGRIVSQIRPDLLDEGFGMWIAFEGAAPGIKAPGWITGNKSPTFLIQEADSLGSTAAKLSGFLAVVSIGFGIWQTITAAKKIKNGSQIAKEFRILTENLTSARKSILKSFNKI